MSKFRIGILTSAWDSVALELVREVHKAVTEDVIPDAEIAFIFVSRDEGETRWGDRMIEAVREMGLPLVTFSSMRFDPEGRANDHQNWRLRHDRELMKLLPPTDLDVLLGYMWWAGREMCWRRTMINLHPALPGGPKGTYRDVIWELIRSGATETGVMIHLVTPDLDEGPAIAYCRYPIRGGEEFDAAWRMSSDHLFSLIRREGVKRELPLIVEAIKLVAEGKVSVILEKWVISWEDGVLENGYDLTDAVNLAVTHSTPLGKGGEGKNVC